MPFWKSAPYLAHFMHGYKFHDLPRPGARHGRSAGQDRGCAPATRCGVLRVATLRSWGSIDPGNAKLRELVGELIDEGLWRP